MIDELHINYLKNRVLVVTLSVDTTDENLPYNLADLFLQVMEDSEVNTDMVIQQLIDNTGYNEKDREMAD